MENIIKRILIGFTVHELALARTIIDDLLNDHSVKVQDLEGSISTRLDHVFKDINIVDLLEFSKIHRSEFEKVRNVGVLTLKEVDELLEYYNLAFKPSAYDSEK